MIRRLIRGKPKSGGVDKVFTNLCLGLDKLKVSYQVNLPFSELKKDDYVGVLGRGRRCLDGYDRTNPIVAGIALMAHPSEWPTLCEDFPVVRYLQHSEWANNIYKPYFGDRCAIWPVGIDVGSWRPVSVQRKTVDFLVYDKIHWDRERLSTELVSPILTHLKRNNLTSEAMRYGSYQPADFKRALERCRSMIFLCEHESQGIAYQECLASGVPILAWDQGWFLDPNRFKWGTPNIAASSVPYFDERCGRRFKAYADFPDELEKFVVALNNEAYSPREFVLENLTLEKSAGAFLQYLEAAASPQPARL